MAKEVLTIITDDLDGSKKAKSVSFALEGVEYSIDLGDKNLAKLRTVLAPYIEAGEKVSKSSRRSSRSSASGKRTDSAAIRAWAKESGMSVPSRGRIPQSVVDAYEAAH